MKQKHYVITLENRHWPMTYKTTSAADAYECIANLLYSKKATYPGYREGYLIALASMDAGTITQYESPGISGITVYLVDGEV